MFCPYHNKEYMKNDIRILVVDDEAIMRSLFTDILEDRGYRVTVVNNGQEAIDLAKDVFFQVAFIDVHMPVMNGIQTLRILRVISPNTAVVMMDSFPDVLLDEINKDSTITCIHKPFDIKEVREAIENRVVKVV